MAKKPSGGRGRERQTQQGRPEKRDALLSVRVQPSTRKAIEDEAARKNRTISLEVDERLSRSLASEELLARAYGPAHVRGLAALVALLVAAIERPCGAEWRSDAYVAKAVDAGVQLILQALGAQGRPSAPAGMLGGMVKNTPDHPLADPQKLGELVAAQLVGRIAGSVSAPREFGEYIAAALVGTNTELSEVELQIRSDLNLQGGTR